ncbi:MAG: aromatic ring-hydroxylating oxygenase subunit alpha [Arenicellales bacterium WSBS_2016_MAG_OTU3]
MHKSIKNQLKKVLAPIDVAATLPPVCYHSDEIFALEQQSVFSSSWVSVGRSDRWKKAGDFLTFDVAGVPLVIVLNGKGQLNAYANSCRHRGSKLVSGAGNCKTLRCPFHRWTYNLDGSLLTAPGIEHSDSFNYKEYGLVSIRLVQYEGFVLVNVDGSADSLTHSLGDFPVLHSQWELSRLKTGRYREFDVDCNWKMFMEVFNEYYHLPAVHPSSINRFYLEPETSDEVNGAYATQFGKTTGNSALLAGDDGGHLPVIHSLDERNRNGTRYTWVYPNLTFAANRDCVWIYETWPLSPHKTRVGMTACFPEATVASDNFEEIVSRYYHRLDLAIAEDIPALVNQHDGMKSPLAQPGRFCEKLEPSVAKFAAWYAQRMMDVVL